MGALLNYLKSARLVSSDAQDDEAAVRELSNSISEMLVAMSKHASGSTATSSREIKEEVGASRMERIQALLDEARAIYPSLDAEQRYLLVEASNP